MRGPFKAISQHGLVPLVLGTLLAFTGTKAMVVRSVALLVCALWLSLDIGLAIAERKWSKYLKIDSFCAATCLCFCVGMLIMYSFLAQVLADQQNDTFDGIVATMELPPSGLNQNSTFTVTNNGHNQIGKYTVFCRIIVGRAPHSKADNATANYHSVDSPLNPGSDAESIDCLSYPFTLAGLDPYWTCLDVIAGIDYALTTQLETIKDKKFRYISQKDRGFKWHQQPIELRGSPCL
jgi:hypothetical protein